MAVKPWIYISVCAWLKNWPPGINFECLSDKNSKLLHTFSERKINPPLISTHCDSCIVLSTVLEPVPVMLFHYMLKLCLVFFSIYSDLVNINHWRTMDDEGLDFASQSRATKCQFKVWFALNGRIQSGYWLWYHKQPSLVTALKIDTTFYLISQTC